MSGVELGLNAPHAGDLTDALVMQEPLRICGAAIAALDAELDWPLLGRAYCEGDARDYFDAAQRENLLETGLLFADDLARALRPGGRSLYLGAAVAELVPLLTERLVLERDVHWLNLPGVELSELVRAADVVGARLGLQLPSPSALPIEHVAEASCDHLWMVSVLTDPDAFPALHDELYERAETPLATGRGAAADERLRATALVDAWLARAAPSCLVSTTDEELVLLRPRIARLGWRIEVPREGRYTALVGDVVRHCRLQR
jgi:hypothetical protein